MLKVRLWNAAAAVLVVLHGGLAIDAARRLSPTWDEITYPAAGLAQWRSGEIRLNTLNPFLPKLLYALPLLASGARTPFDYPSWEKKDDYRFGFQFTFRNERPARRLIFLSRVVPVLFSLATALLLFIWLRALLSPAAGFFALAVYACTPILLSRASIAQAEMPMFFFIIAALLAHGRWEKTGTGAALVATGTLAGLALLCKLAALPLLAMFFVWEILRPDRRWHFLGRLGPPAAIAAVAAAVYTLAYVPWKGGVSALRASLENVVIFTKAIPYHFHGQTYVDAPSLLTWGAFAVKAPPAILLLAAAGAWAWAKSGRERGTWLRLALLAAAVQSTVLAMKNPMFTIQLSPFYLAAAAFAAGIPFVFTGRRAWAIAGLLVWAAVDVARLHPNHLGYFNVFAGGPDKGWQWATDSDQDWGQGLGLLAEEVNRRPVGRLLLAYSGSGDPAAYGLTYVDVFSPALVSAERRDDLSPLRGPAHLAVGTKMLTAYPRLFAWPLAHLRPVASVKACFIVWDISSPEAREWLKAVYETLGRVTHAQWVAESLPHPTG